MLTSLPAESKADEPQHEQQANLRGLLYRTPNIQQAEELRARLLIANIVAAVKWDDPIGLLGGIAEVLVWSVDHAAANAILEANLLSDEFSDWKCHHCGSVVPSHIEVCWNCLIDED